MLWMQLLNIEFLNVCYESRNVCYECMFCCATTFTVELIRGIWKTVPLKNIEAFLEMPLKIVRGIWKTVPLKSMEAFLEMPLKIVRGIWKIVPLKSLEANLEMPLKILIFSGILLQMPLWFLATRLLATLFKVPLKKT